MTLYVILSEVKDLKIRFFGKPQNDRGGKSQNDKGDQPRYDKRGKPRYAVLCKPEQLPNVILSETKDLKKQY